MLFTKAELPIAKSFHERIEELRKMMYSSVSPESRVGEMLIYWITDKSIENEYIYSPFNGEFAEEEINVFKSLGFKVRTNGSQVIISLE